MIVARRHVAPPCSASTGGRRRADSRTDAPLESRIPTRRACRGRSRVATSAGSDPSREAACSTSASRSWRTRPRAPSSRAPCSPSRRASRYAWLWDSHVLWQDPYPIFALCAQATIDDPPRDLRDQPGHEGPDGDRIGDGDAPGDLGRPHGARHRARRLRPARARPHAGHHRAPRACLRRDPRACRGREVALDGTAIRLPWTLGHKLPIWVAAYGPKALRCAGRIADGVILQLADPYVIEWAHALPRGGRSRSGPLAGDITVMAAAPPT